METRREELLRRFFEKCKIEEVQVWKVDRKNLKAYMFKLPVLTTPEGNILTSSLKNACNVGDFVIIPPRKILVRVRGGLREANSAEIAELLSFAMSEANFGGF